MQIKIKKLDNTNVPYYLKINKVDESPEAYKNIFEVMELQKDLVEVITHVKPILNIKG